MLRLGRADLESEAGAQRLNLMLWDRCKAGKITQSEYMSLVDNRDVRLKKLLVERNLTLNEARLVRQLVMEYQLTITGAVAVAKEKMTLEEAQRKQAEVALREQKNREERKRKATLKAQSAAAQKAKREGLQRTAAQAGKRVVQNRQAQRTPCPKNDENEVNNAPDTSRNVQKTPTRQPLQGTHQSNRQIENKPLQPQKQAPDQKAQRPNAQRPQALPLHSQQNVAGMAKEKLTPQARSSRSTIHSAHHPFHQQEQSQISGNRRTQASVVPRRIQQKQTVQNRNFDRNEYSGNSLYSDDITTSQQWRDWREERNIRLQEKQKNLQPIPPGQDWYPGMGFRPADDPPEFARSTPQRQLKIETRAEANERILPKKDFLSPENASLEPVRAGKNPHCGENTESRENNFSGMQKRRPIIHTRRFVPRKKGFR